MFTYPVLLAHGLEGSPAGRKAATLRAAGVQLTCPDARGLTLAERIQQVEPIAASLGPMILVGSSYGGLVALWLAQRFPSQIRGLVLCAPALQRIEAPLFDALSVPATLRGHILHGVHDVVVPVHHSKSFASRHPNFTLELVDDDHSLRSSLPNLVAAVLRYQSDSLPS